MQFFVQCRAEGGAGRGLLGSDWDSWKSQVLDVKILRLITGKESWIPDCSVLCDRAKGFSGRSCSLDYTQGGYEECSKKKSVYWNSHSSTPGLPLAMTGCRSAPHVLLWVNELQVLMGFARTFMLTFLAICAIFGWVTFPSVISNQWVSGIQLAVDFLKTCLRCLLPERSQKSPCIQAFLKWEEHVAHMHVLLSRLVCACVPGWVGMVNNLVQCICAEYRNIIIWGIT